jgi:DNA-binding response OmpR family regulator
MSEAAKRNHILLVDDSEGGRFAIARMLQVAGFRVTEAANGTDGLRLAREMPDLVVLDVRLPDMSGYDVCRNIKSFTFQPASSARKTRRTASKAAPTDT